MPKDIVTTDIEADTAAQRQDTDVNVAVVGTAEEQPPDAEFGDVTRYTTAADVSDDYGDDSDVHAASQNIQEMGAAHWYVQVLEAVEVTDETVADGETLSETPVLGEHEVSSPDGDIAFSTGDPVDAEDYEEPIVINPDTGEVATEETEIEISYFTADFTELEEMPDAVDRIGPADRRCTRRHIGVLEELQTFASGRELGMVANGPNADEYEDLDAARVETSDVAGYVPSADLMMIVDRSSDDLASYQLGEQAVNDPFHNPFRDEIPGGTPIRSQVGEPGEEETFEGGDEDGNGPVNVLISVAGVNRLSNSITTAGEGSEYRYWDVRRTTVFFDHEIDAALETLAANQEVPFTEDGQTMIEDALVDLYEQYTGGTNVLAEYEIDIADPDDEEVDRANRDWGGIEVWSRLTGSAHQFRVTATFEA